MEWQQCRSLTRPEAETAAVAAAIGGDGAFGGHVGAAGGARGGPLGPGFVADARCPGAAGAVAGERVVQHLRVVYGGISQAPGGAAEPGVLRVRAGAAVDDDLGGVAHVQSASHRINGTIIPATFSADGNFLQ